MAVIETDLEKTTKALTECRDQITELMERSDSYFEENKQLKEALKQNTFQKASDQPQPAPREGHLLINDDKIITDLAFDLRKKHPYAIEIKWKDNKITEVVLVDRH